MSFEETVERIRERDPRFGAEAYAFLRDALDFTMKRMRSAGEADDDEDDRHVSGPELLDGFREYALREFGPMVPVVMEDWGLHSGEDVGEMVFNLIEEGVFGKSDTDTLDDFRNVLDFREAFVRPFLPRRQITPFPRAGVGSRTQKGNHSLNSES